MKPLLDLARECGARVERHVVKSGFYGRADEYVMLTESQLSAFAERIRAEERYIIDLLVAAGHVTSEKVDEARRIAAAIRSSGEQAECAREADAGSAG